jgi:hypothetical protein
MVIFSQKGVADLKTNKELAVELTIGFLQAWSTNDKSKAVTAKTAIEVLNAFNEALIKLDSAEKKQ